jgi:hypothetical protein
MKKKPLLNVLAALLVFTVLPILFSSPAGAFGVYDDFTSAGINTSLWFDFGPNMGLYSEPSGGPLSFNDATGGQWDILSSANPESGAFFVSMQYSNLSANNTNALGSGKASVAAVFVGYQSNAVLMNEYEESNNYGFLANSDVNGTVTVLSNPPPSTTVTGGTLGIYYNGVLGPGGMVSFWYNTGSGWIYLTDFAPNFSTTPYFGISGEDLYGQSLSFDVSNVTISQDAPVPLPPSLLLLGPGLLGLLAMRRRSKG